MYQCRNGFKDPGGAEVVIIFMQVVGQSSRSIIQGQDQVPES